MAPKKWEEEDSDSDTPPSSPPPPVLRRGKFDDEEEDSDVLDSWDAAEDSEVEQEKAKKAAEAKAMADAAAQAAKKSKAQRIAEHKAENARRRAAGEEESSEEEEDEATRRAKLLREQKEADLRHAEDLFGDMGSGNAGTGTRSAAKPVTAVADPSNPASTIELSNLKVFNPNTKDQFLAMRETLVPLITTNVKKAHYTLFMQEFAKQLCKDLPSDQIKKIASGLTTLSNEKMKEEKAAEKGGKKSKTKAKATLNATRDISHKADVSVYDDDGLGDDDFM